MSYNLIHNDEFRDSWLNLTQDELQITKNPAVTNDPFFKENPHLLIVDLFKNPDYLAYAVWILFEVQLLPFQAAILSELWVRPFPLFVGCRGLGKTFLLAVFSMLRAAFYPDYKVVVVGAAFRQSRLIFEYCEKLWERGPVFRSLCSSNSGPKKNVDKCVFHINNSTITAIPVGTGDKIRGLRANTVIADEFDSHNRDIFETVIQGFLAVNADPANNVSKIARLDKLKEMGIDIDDRHLTTSSNQMIISGTAGYYFGTFYEYFKKYKKIVESKGDPTIIDEIFSGDPPEGFSWRDFSVIRVPYQLLPRGFMDDKVIARARATTNKAIFAMEYEAVFAEDSDGFFKRSVIERAVANDKNVSNVNWFPWCTQPFDPQLRGHSRGRYVMGIDPASEIDNLAITILELFPEHARIVYVWTTNKKDFQERKKAGFVHEDGYYSFVARKIRELMKVFPCSKIGMDTQGGGYALMEALAARNNLQPGEEPFWEVIDYDKPKPSDSYEGRHIIEPIQFARYEWTHEANFALQKDLEGGKLLFPRFDPVTIDMSIITDKARIEIIEKEKPDADRKLLVYDTLEDAVLEVEELKNELASIMVTKAPGVTSRFRWVVPEVKLNANKKTTARKDRYSSLLIANSLAREMYKDMPREHNMYAAGGFLVGQPKQAKKDQPLYVGPEWYTSAFNKILGR